MRSLFARLTWSNVLAALPIIGALLGVYINITNSIEVLKTDNANIKANITIVQENQRTTYNDLTNQLNEMRADLRAFYGMSMARKQPAEYELTPELKKLKDM